MKLMIKLKPVLLNIGVKPTAVFMVSRCWTIRWQCEQGIWANGAFFKLTTQSDFPSPASDSTLERDSPDSRVTCDIFAPSFFLGTDYR